MCSVGVPLLRLGRPRAGRQRTEVAAEGGMSLIGSLEDLGLGDILQISTPDFCERLMI